MGKEWGGEKKDVVGGGGGMTELKHKRIKLAFQAINIFEKQPSLDMPLRLIDYFNERGMQILDPPTSIDYLCGPSTLYPVPCPPVILTRKNAIKTNVIGC